MSFSREEVVAHFEALKASVTHQIDETCAKMASKLPSKEPFKVNLLIPMAGAGSRFSKAGYTTPKPMIPVRGSKPMVRMVVDNILAPNVEATYIYVVQKAHYDQYNLQELLNSVTPGCKIFCVTSLTEGAACTCLIAREAIDNDVPLLIANSDQFVEWDAALFYEQMRIQKPYGGVLCFRDPTKDPKWSFARTEDGTIHTKIIEVKEKVAISDLATVGVYYWRRGSDFCADTDAMIKANIRVNGEFYVCPIYQVACDRGEDIRVAMCDKMWGTGTPEDLKDFEANYKGEI